jgi:hypothetical protein
VTGAVVTVVFEAGSKLPLLDCGQDGAAIGCSGRVLAATWGAVRAEHAFDAFTKDEGPKQSCFS